ncbi:lysosomal-trafficking regulator-like isoform X2 [Asterias rubens]|uniref:lysosomal-trafficking regulator-like isoform X2 n=1 Tax=Asterias rubens TaxID=7604 RepID=UPI0014554665|nr:lysosomal-trafficking regulator-like isoform X2 [Asterias rubens]
MKRPACIGAVMEECSQMGRNLRGRWEAFICLPQGEMTEALQREKHLLLEDFLRAFLVMSANPAIDKEDLVNFCNDIHSVFNILVRQFMSDVQELAPSHQNPPALQEPPLAKSPLMEFLMHGRGWLILNALCNLSSQALDFSPDFVCLLVQFIEEALNLPIGDKDKDRTVKIPKLESCLQKKKFSKKTLMSIGFANSRRPVLRSHPASNPPSPSRLPSMGNSPHFWRKTGGSRDNMSNHSSDSDTGERRSSRSSLKEPKHVYPRQAPLPKVAILGEVPIVDWKPSVDYHQCKGQGEVVDAFDLCLVLLSLLERLCGSEVMQSIKRNALALFLAPKLTDVLTYLNNRTTGITTSSDDESTSAHISNRWTLDLIGTLQKLVLRIVVSLCMYSCTQHYEAPKLASSGILFTLLQIAKCVGQNLNTQPETVSLRHKDTLSTDAVNDRNVPTEGGEAKLQQEVKESSARDSWKDVPHCHVHYINEILHGVILLLMGVMHSCCDNQIVVTHAMALLNEFAMNGGYTFTESLLEFLDQEIRCLGEDSPKSQILKECIVNLLSSMSKLLIATKRAKLEYVHKFQCLKRTHNTCDYTHYTHHHHSMFGIAYSTYEDLKQTRVKSLPLEGTNNPLFRARQSKCCIAVIIEMMLGLLMKVQYKGLTIRILFALEQGGICCCLPPKLIVSVFLRSLQRQPAAMRSYLLSVLGKLILEQLGGSERSEGAIRGICEECANLDVQHSHVTAKDMKHMDHYMSSDSAICSDGSQHEEDERSSRWKVLDLYTPILMSEDDVLSQQISVHLLNLVRHSNKVIKEELYFNVFLSCFRYGSCDTIDGPPKLPCVTSPTVLGHIFCSLPLLLNTLSAQMQFLVEGGLTQLVKLLDLPSTRLHVLRVFEVLILSEESQGALIENHARSDTTDSGGSKDENRDTFSVVQAFIEVLCNVLPCKPQTQKKIISHPKEKESHEDWFLSCEVIEDPVEPDVYRATQNSTLLEEGKVAFAASLNTLQEVEDGKELDDSFEALLGKPDHLSKMSEATLSKAADVWRVAGNILLHSSSFQDQFVLQGVDVLASDLFLEALVSMTRMWKMCEDLPVTWSPYVVDKARLRTISEFRPIPLNLFQILLDIVGSLLRICLTLQGHAENEQKWSLLQVLTNCKGILKQSKVLHSALGRLVAEMLLKVAQMQIYVHPGTFCGSTTECDVNGDGMLHWDLDELQEAISSDSQSDVGESLSAEEGYEADSEREKEGTISGDCRGAVNMDKVEVVLSQRTLLHPQVCLLLLDLVESSERVVLPAEVACYTIKQITAIARSCQTSQDSLYQSGLPKTVLRNYRSTTSLTEQVLLLELFAVLVQQSLSTEELRDFLQLFQTDTQVVNEALLSTLLTIVRNTTSQPSHVLRFPAVKPFSGTPLRSRSNSSGSPGFVDINVPPDDSTAEETSSGPLQIQQGFNKSPWNIAPVQLPISSNFPWPPTGKGFFITAWVKVDELRILGRLGGSPGMRRKVKVFRQTSVKMNETPTSEKRTVQRKESSSKTASLLRNGLHFFSVGNQDLMVQVWVEARTCRLTIRLSRFTSRDDQVVLIEKSCSNLLTLSTWQHLALGYAEKAEGLTRTGTISVIINGHIQREIVTEYAASPSSNSQPKAAQPRIPHCLLGHCVQEGSEDTLPNGSWQLGNVLLFNDAHVLNQEVAFHLYTMGTDCVTISSCEGSKQSTLYSQYISQDILNSALSVEILTGNREVDLKPARESLVVSYSPSNTDIFSHYEAITQSSSTLGRVLGGSLRSVSNALLQTPSSMESILLCPVTTHAHRGLQNAIYESGGIGVFVFLFAKVFENCNSKSMQAKALKLLTNLQGCSRTLAAEFNDMMAASMIAKVLVTARSIVGFEMLKVMLDACLSKPIIYHCCLSKLYRVHSDTHAIIQDTRLVSGLLLDWRVWEKAEPGVLQMLFQCIETLIEAENPFQAFNITQLLSIRCVNRLLMICKERHHEDLPCMAPHTCSSIVSIIKGLMGQPPDVNLLAEVCDFLLAIHPAVNTFVCHAQSSFYFSHHSFVQQDYKQELMRKISRTVSSEGSLERLRAESALTALYVSDEECSTDPTHTSDTDSSSNLSKSANPEKSSSASLNTEEAKVLDMSGLCSGLLNLLAEALVVLPDSSLSKVLGIVLKPDTLIVLSHHESPLIRTRVIQLLDVFFHRATMSQVDAFLKRRSFHLLANQLHQYPATRDLMEACLTITLGKPVDMTLGLELMLLQESDKFQHMSSVLLMSLLENSVHDFSLCHDGICMANQLFEGVDQIADVMLANGLVETLCNVLSAICSNLPKDDDDARTMSRHSSTSSDTSQELKDDQNNDSKIGRTEIADEKTEVVTRDIPSGGSLHSEAEEEGALCEDASGSSRPDDSDEKNLENVRTLGEINSNSPKLDSLHPLRASIELNGLTEDQTAGLKTHDEESDLSVSKRQEAQEKSSPGSSLHLPGEDTRISAAMLILIKDVQHFMACIANRVFSSSSQFDSIESMLHLLGDMEERHRAKYGPASAVTDVVYETQSYIIKELLDHFKATSMAIDAAATKGKKSLSFQRSATYSERKYEEHKWQRNAFYSIGSRGSVSSSRRMFASTSSLSSELSPTLEDSMSIISGDQMKEFGFLAEDRRYSTELDTLLRMQRSHSNKKKVPIKKLADEELLAKRFQRICLLTVNLVVQRDPSLTCQSKPATSVIPDESYLQPPESTYKQLCKYLFHLLTDAFLATMERKLGQRKQWETIVWSSRETLRLQLHRLLVHMMSPKQATTIRVYLLRIARMPSSNRILQAVLNSNLQSQHHLGKFELYLFDLLHHHASEITKADKKLCQKLMDILEQYGFHPLYPEDMDNTSRDRVAKELEKLVSDEQSVQETNMKQRLDGGASAWAKLGTLSGEVANSAMEVTQLVAAYQNGQRLRFLEFLKSTIASSLDVQSSWQDLIQSLTHERAIWYDAKSYPSSWSLDPTEGPGRVRRRLQRSHLHIPAKFFIPQLREAHESEPTLPLKYLFEDSLQSSDSSEFKRRLQKNEKISCAFFCKMVSPALETKGDLLQGVNSMYFVSEELPDNQSIQVNPFDHDMLTISWLYEDIKELHLRWYQLRDNALEIFLTNGQTLLLAFENTKERDTLYQQIKSCDLPNLVEVDDISAITQAWRMGQSTNYEYLTQLNKLSGRSFNDLMQYPVFPFILCDYTSNVLDLMDPKSYRDLTRPVAVQTQAMEIKYKENYKFLHEEYQKLRGFRMGSTMFWTKPYHYGSHYSNSGTVLQYLVRLPPFTKMFLQYQDNHFDLPDRTFHSVDTSWRLSSFQSSTDVKELIPEFFFLPEFFLNNEGFHFGVRQSGLVVNHVNLPPWAKGSARLFTQIHRQALESVCVSEYLHAWLDLVFGVKQQGSLAVEAVNVFHPATYFGIDTTAIKDPVKQRAVETMIKTYGQTPKQLFVNYHPPRIEADIFPDNFGMGTVGILVGLSQRQQTMKANASPDASVWGPVNTVKGMKWGNYLGSASSQDPVIRFQKQYPVPLDYLNPLPTGDVCAVAQHLCLLLMYSKEKGVSSMNAVDIKWSGIISWGHADGVLRVHTKRKALLLLCLVLLLCSFDLVGVSSMNAVDIKWSGIISWGHADGVLRVHTKRKALPINLLHTTPTDKISCCSSISDCRLLFTGSVSGVIAAYPTRYNPDKQCNIEVVGAAVRLFGHTARIISLCVCRPYSIMVSAGEDGLCIIWDLNRLCYVRSLCDDTGTGHLDSITAVTVSDVSGDIATASNSDDRGSEVRLWTVNASLVTKRVCDSSVHCLTFSNAPEGIAVNSLVAGCEDGVIRFWSSIDLTPVRVIVTKSHTPIISLSFTNDSQFLAASDENGLLTMWGNKETNRKVPKVEAFLGIGNISKGSKGRLGSNS